MTSFPVSWFKSRPWTAWCLLVIGCAVTLAAYWPGLSGGFLFDDYPNIIDNKAVQPSHASLPLLINAALSSPSSEFKRPLASLSFAINYVMTGLDPYWMKLTNLVIHLLNALLLVLLSRNLLWLAEQKIDRARRAYVPESAQAINRLNLTAVLVATSWMLLPINLTSVLYVVQRMESLANLFVLLGLLGYLAGRKDMLGLTLPTQVTNQAIAKGGDTTHKGLFLCILSITIPVALGALAKETAVMLPLYAFLIEWLIFGFRTFHSTADRRLAALFVVVLALPLAIGLAWLLPHTLNPSYWSTREFTLSTRLLSEARILVAYIRWILLPTPDALSFYHDNFVISTGLLTPWTTLASIAALLSLAALAWALRSRQPLVTLGIALYLGCHLLTGTILPLELVYEHRNYFASMGLILAVVPLLAGLAYQTKAQPLLLLPRRTLLIGLMALWCGETTMTATAWGDPLLLAETLATRAPDSPRAQYELGRTYIIYSRYDPNSRFTHLAYAPLERAAALPGSSILPEQALIFMNSRMHLPLKDAWWETLIDKLRTHKPTVQDESSLGSLTQCARTGDCALPVPQMMAAYQAALSHPGPSARLLAMYGDYAWNILRNRGLGLRATEGAVAAAPDEPAYRITLVRMLVACGRLDDARAALSQLNALNVGGRLNSDLLELNSLPGLN